MTGAIPSHHIVRAYDDELKRLHGGIVTMGGLAVDQLAAALTALDERDADLAASVVSGDAGVDAADHNINDLTVRLLALRSPVANDLRLVITTLKTASELERVADLAVNIAKRAMVLNQYPLLPPAHAILRMGEGVVASLRDVVTAYSHGDTDTALRIWEQDRTVDEQCSALFRELLTYMMEDPRNITTCSHLMFIAKNIERVGDHATNIAELIHYRVTGEALTGDRPKVDTSSFRIE